MQMNRSAKLGSLSAVTWPLAVGALVLVSCGGDTASGSSVSTISLDATNYIVKEPVTTTTEPSGVESGITDGSQIYKVQAGDYPLLVADQFGVPLEDLLNFNGWATSSEFPFPGEDIKIPPGGKIPTATTPTVSGDDPDEPVGESIPEAGSNCEPGSYTIVEGDYLGKVAGNFDVTVEALNAANTGTSGYSSFYVGLKIVIPAKADC